MKDQMTKNADLPAMPLSTDMDDALEAAKNPKEYRTGLTKLEHFAGLAMQGLLANSEKLNLSNPDEELRMAGWSVSFAKALLNQLEKGDE